MRQWLIVILGLCFGLTGISAQIFNVNGLVTDEEGEPLIGAHVYCTELAGGEATNGSGFYTLNMPAGSYHLVFSYVGYQSDTLVLQLNANRTQNIELKVQSISEVVVEANRWDNAGNNAQLGQVKLLLSQIKRLPSLGGEVDIMKALSLTPGVNNGSEGSSGLYVRGGTPDQNLILLDDAVVYNPNHLFGFLSVFNSDAIKDVTLTKGNFPAHYGGRLSSVLDVKMKEGNFEKLKGEVGVGLLTSRLILDGPIVKDKLSFMFSGRSSYLGLFLLPTKISYNNGSSDNYFNYFMADFNAKINYVLNKTDRLSLSLYSGSDQMKIFSQSFPVEESRSRINWGNLTATLRYSRAFASGVFWENTLGYTRFKYNFDRDGRLSDQGLKSNAQLKYSSNLQDIFLKSRISFSLGTHHRLRTGIEITEHQFRPRTGTYSYSDSSSVETFTRTDQFDGLSLATYVEDDWQILSKVKLNLGLRWSALSIDHSFFNAWEPRVSMFWQLKKDVALKAGYSRTQQYIQLLTSSNLGLQNDIWAPSTQAIPPQQAEQFAIGFARYFQKWDLDFSAELYYKRMSNLIAFKEGVNLQFALEKDWQDLIETAGDGTAYGFEFFLHKKSGKINGMLSYAYARSLRQFQGINNGKEYSFKYDAPHQVSVAANWQISPKVDVSFSWIFQSGFPISLPTSVINPAPGDRYDEAPIFIYGELNAYRLPVYHRADIALNHTKVNRWNKKQTWSFSIYNLYNRKNVLYAQWSNVYSGLNEQNKPILKPKLQLQSFLPILPSISYSVAF